MKKNCNNCKHLEYFDDGPEGPEPGFYCNNRSYTSRKEELKHLKKLEDNNYLAKSKKCCELKVTKDN